MEQQVTAKATLQAFCQAWFEERDVYKRQVLQSPPYSTEVLEKGFWIPGIPLRNVLRWAERLETTRGSISLTQRK